MIFLSKTVTPKPRSTDDFSPDTSCSGDNRLRETFHRTLTHARVGVKGEGPVRREGGAKGVTDMIAVMLLALATNPCASAQTQADLDVCWRDRAQQADVELNAAYKKAFADLHGMGLDPQPLAGVQLSWITARDKTCDFEESMNAGGTIAPMMYSECFDRMTRARTQRIEGFVATLKAGDDIKKAAPASRKVDAELNRVYGLLQKRDLTPAQSKALTTAELAWLAYRDKACKVEGNSCMDELETERVAEMEDGWLGEQFW
jgi:uncharacterized protein YecT (DUF1311 family)